jgi:putative spermidine/putrescine transport system substrate-binding protein
MHRRSLLQATVGLTLAATASTGAFAFEGAELYPGEKTLYAAAEKEGLVVSFDTGPEWAYW